MKGLSHSIIGATTGIVLSSKLGTDPLMTVGFTILGSIIVDIDEKHSTINKLLFPVPVAMRNIIKGAIGIGLFLTSQALLKYLGIILILSIVSGKLELRFNFLQGVHARVYHRTMFHDPIIGLGLLVIPLYMVSIPQQYLIAYTIGLATHYLADSFNEYGLPLYLLNGKKLRFPLSYSSTNFVAEYLIVTTYLGGIIYLNYLA